MEEWFKGKGDKRDKHSNAMCDAGRNPKWEEGY